MSTFTDIRFAELDSGQKFECYDMTGVHEKICGNAAVCKVNGSFKAFTFDPDEIVRAYTGVAHMEGANV